MRKAVLCLLLLLAMTVVGPRQASAAAPTARDFSRAAAISSVSIARDGT